MGRRGRVREVAFGSDRRIGLWILPLFLVTGLIGATLAGTLAVLYFAQQVRELEETTAAARAELTQARDEVVATASEATAAIAAEAERVRGELAALPPVESPNAAGVYAVAATHADGEVRVGTAFTLFSDERETWFVANYRVVRTADGFAVPTGEVFLPDQTVTVGVHNFDRDRDVVVLVARGGPIPVLPWRPADAAVTRGDGLWLAGVAGTDTAAVYAGRVAGVSAQAVLPDLGLNAFLSGGPLLDAEGRVVAISSLDHAPFGKVAGDLTYAVPIRVLCERLIACTAADLGAGSLGEPGGVGALPAPAATEDVPAALPSPAASGSPSPRPSPRPSVSAATDGDADADPSADADADAEPDATTEADADATP